MRLEDLETPCLLLDREKMRRNAAHLRGRLAELGPGLRLHVKTVKSAEAAREILGRENGPITVSTLKEAEEFLAAGFRDILYAVGVAPNKLGHAADLRRRGADLCLTLDSAEAARAVAERGAAEGVRFSVALEIDCDGHRAGIGPEDPLLLATAAALAGDGAAGAELRGVLTHAGSSYDGRTPEEIAAVAERERLAVVTAARRLREAGFAAPLVSVGSSPTAAFATDLTGITEVRAGVFAFGDLMMVRVGVSRLEDVALSVLASVIGHQRDKGWILIDAGWTALSRDRGFGDQGYGRICDLDGRPLDGLIVHAVNQEHGIVTGAEGAPADPGLLPVGSLVRILPNHACATAEQHAAYQVVEGGREVVATWPRFRGW